MNNSLDNASNETSNILEGDCFLPLAHGIALITTNAIIGVLGTLGNLLVCVAVITNPRLRRSSNYLLLSLAIADLIVTMLSEPVFVAQLVRLIGRNECAPSLSLAFVFVFNFSLTVSMAHLAAISVDRLLAVVYPLRHKGIMESFGLKTMLSVCWILPLMVVILSRSLQAPLVYNAFITLAVFALSFAVVFVSYSAIVICLARQSKKRRQISTRSTSSSAAAYRFEVRVTFALGIAIIVFTACWLPLFIAYTVNVHKPLIKPHKYEHMWLWTVALSNSAMNFLIYGSRIRNFGDAYMEILKKILKYARIKSRQGLDVRRVNPQD